MHRIAAWGDRKARRNILLCSPYIPDGERHCLEGTEKAGPESLDQEQERDGPKDRASERLDDRTEGH
jgi:hypothetical protein